MKKTMNNNNINQKTTFWEFLTNNTIEIPIIQRDYAQGRSGKEYLRKSFLADIKDALDNALKDDGKTEMKLDFVYGSVENDKLSPLDGQQRLTTLWLLHWYIALMSRNLNEDICEILKKFTYETRISSREFCQNLCKPENFKDYEQYISTQGDRKVVEYITSRTWFYSAWKQDPTVQSMLRMLGGTEINDKIGEDIVDGLEELFKCPEICEIKTNEKCKLLRDFKSYWKLLVDNAPIVFYQLPLKDFGLSDDLYIKMNARGKQLTSFENFKADLVGYITSQSKSELLNEIAKEEWKELLDAKNGIPIKMDTIWTDIFWRERSPENRIDEIFFAFLNRFFLNELICLKDNGKYMIKAEDIEKNPMFTYLYGNKSDDTKIEYVGLEKYYIEGSNLPKIFFDNLGKSLDCFTNVNIPKQSFIPQWGEKGFLYIPKYDGESISKFGQKERIVFLAVSRYFQLGNYNEKSFKQWMRVVWNIVENGGVDTISAMIGVMRLIDELSNHSHNIYAFLADENNIISSNAAQEQVKEERAKAKQITNGAARSDNKSWEKVIVEAENYAFFKGAIRFLFQDEKGNVTEESWEKFDTKWRNAQKYFDENGVSESCRESSILLRALLSRIDISERWFGNHADFWHNTLLNSDTQFLSAVHYLLSTKDLEVASNCGNWIRDDKLLEILLGNYDSWHILKNWRNYSVITRYSRRESNPSFSKEIVVLNSQRNTLLQMEDITIQDDCIVGSGNYLYGWDIDFKFKTFFFRWFGNPNDKELDVYLMEEKWNDYKKRANPTTEKNTEEDEWYCFRVTPKMEEYTTLFTEELYRLIDEAKQNGDFKQ